MPGLPTRLRSRRPPHARRCRPPTSTPSTTPRRVAASALTGWVLLPRRHFAFADSLDEDIWLELTAASLTQQPDLEDADYVAERAAHTPASRAAQLIAAAALDHGRADGHRRTATIRHAATLYADAPAGNTPEREALRIALINAGAIDDAYGS